MGSVTLSGRLGGAVLAVVVLVLVLVLVLVPQAWAARATVRDDRGDARAPWDITKVMVVNGQRKLRIRVVYRGRLRPKPPLGLLTNIRLDMGSPSAKYSADFEVSLLLGSGDPEAPDGVRLTDSDFARVRCAGLRGRGRPRRKNVTFVIPQSCFRGQAGRVRIAGYTYHVRGAADEADYMDSWSRWIAKAPRNPAQTSVSARVADGKVFAVERRYSNGLLERPASLGVGDDASFHDLTWFTWGDATADGNGLFTSSGAAAPSGDWPMSVSVQLSRPRRCGPYRVYTRGVATSTDGRTFWDGTPDLAIPVGCRIVLPVNPHLGEWTGAVRPRRFFVQNASGATFARVRWRGWGRRNAHGKGKLREYCDPGPGGGPNPRCRDGRGVRIRLGDVGYCAARSGGDTGLFPGSLAYRRVTLTGRRLNGERWKTVWSLRRNGRTESSGTAVC